MAVVRNQTNESNQSESNNDSEPIDLSSNVTKDLNNIISMMIKIKDGHVINKPSLKYFNQDDSNSEYSTYIENLFDSNDFIVDYNAVYKLESFNPFSIALSSNKTNSYLELLNEAKDLSTELFILKYQFKIQLIESQLFMKSINNELKCDLIIDRFRQLLNQQLIEQFEALRIYEHKKQNLDFIQNKNRPNSFKYTQLEQFKNRDRELVQLDSILKSKQFVIINGPSGVGKTALALQYSHLKSQKESKLIIRWIESWYDFITLAKNLNFNKWIKYESIVQMVKFKLNTEFKNENIKFILTSCTEFPDIDRINLHEFDEIFCQDYLQLKEFKVNMMLPLKLVRLKSILSNHPQWDMNNINDYLTNNFKFISIENPEAYKLLKHLAFIDYTNISYTLINSIFATQGKEKNNEILKYLVKNIFLTENYQFLVYRIHELDQNDLVKTIDNTDKNLMINFILKGLNTFLTNKEIESKLIFDYHLLIFVKQAIAVDKFDWIDNNVCKYYADIIKKFDKIKLKFCFKI